MEYSNDYIHLVCAKYACMKTYLEAIEIAPEKALYFIQLYKNRIIEIENTYNNIFEQDKIV